MSEQKEINKPKLIRAYLSPERFRVLENIDGQSDAEYIRQAYAKESPNTEQLDWFVVKTLIEEAVSKQMHAVHKRLFKEIEEILKDTWRPTNEFVRHQIIKCVEENFSIARKPLQKISEKLESKEEKLRKLILGDQK